MALTAKEIINRELLSVRPDHPAREVRGLFRSFGVGAVPVVDDARKPLGVLGMRDLGDASSRERIVDFFRNRLKNVPPPGAT